MIRLSCPSCNSSFTLPDLPMERRAACPRCGDVFPVRSWEQVSITEAAALPSTPSSTLRKSRARLSVNRTILVSLVMGLVGLAVGLGIYYSREYSPQRRSLSYELATVSAATPAPELVGLGYLPADASLAFALQPGPALAYAARMKQEPRESLTSAGLPPRVLDALAGVGLRLEQIDHIAGAVNVEELRLSMALVLRQPLNEETFLKQVRATRSSEGKERYSIDFGGLPLALARVSPTIWVFGFDAKKDLAAVDRGGYGPGGRQFAAGLREMISRVPAEAALWIATDNERWAEKPLIRMVASEILKQPEWLPVLARGRALAAALSLGDPPHLRLFVRAADDAAGNRIRKYFQGRTASAEGASAGGAGELAFYDTPIDPTATVATLREMLNEAVKP